MKKSIYISIFTFVCTSNIVLGQVGIGTQTPDASAVLDVVAANKGFLAPQVALTATNLWAPLVAPVSPATLADNEGMLVYNTNTTITPIVGVTPGYYFWDGAAWQPTGIGSRTNIISDGVIPSILGYSPTGTHPVTGTTITVDGVTFTNRGCTQWTTGSGANNHWYCAYTSGNNGTSNPGRIEPNPPLNPGTGGVNWGTAYNVGKSLGGYLVTITSNDELNFVAGTNVIGKNYPSYGTLNNHIWIGNNKGRNRAFALNTPSPGIPVEFYWITGEESKYAWSNSTTVEHNFSGTTEPNNLGDNEGCTHIWSRNMGDASGINGDWNDAPCTKTVFWPGNLSGDGRAMNQLVIEFNQ